MHPFVGVERDYLSHIATTRRTTSPNRCDSVRGLLGIARCMRLSAGRAAGYVGDTGLLHLVPSWLRAWEVDQT